MYKHRKGEKAREKEKERGKGKSPQEHTSQEGNIAPSGSNCKGRNYDPDFISKKRAKKEENEQRKKKSSTPMIIETILSSKTSNEGI